MCSYRYGVFVTHSPTRLGSGRDGPDTGADITGRSHPSQVSKDSHRTNITDRVQQVEIPT